MIGGFNAAIVGPLTAFYQESGQRLEDRLEVVKRYRSAANDLPRLRAEAKQWQEGEHDSTLLLPGASDALAAASLQSTLKRIVEEGSAKLETAQTLAPEAQDNFRRVGVRVAFSADLPLLTAVLLAIETARPVLTVGNLELHTDGESANGEIGGALAIAMDVYGFRSQ